MQRGLHMRFEDPASFRTEYERNIVKGGAFVPSSARWELRSVVTVDLELAWCGESIQLEAEIVFCTPDGTDPRQAGVAVQFLQPIEDLRERLAPIAAAAAGAAPLGAPEIGEPPPAETAAREPGPVPELVPEPDPEPEPLAAADAEGLDLDTDFDLSGEPLETELPEELEVLDEPGGLELDTDAPPLELEPVSPSDPLEDTQEALADLEEDADAPGLELDVDVDSEAPTESGREPLAIDESDVVILDDTVEAEEAAPPPPEPPRPDPLDGVVERRQAERQTARVPVHVDASHISLDGRTRDISENGVLLSADGSDLPLGKKVTLSLTHPNTGERLTIAGTVARHIESKGTVAAVGISFDTRIQDDEHLRDFVREVQAAENARRESGISGVIEELGMANLLQMFGKSSNCGTLTVASGAEEGAVAFENGNVRYVRLGGLRGVKALARLLGWEQGAFEFVSQVDPLPEEDEPMPVEAVLLEAVRQLDEASREEAGGIDLSASLTLDRDALRALDITLSQTEQSVLDLAAAGLSVRRLLDVIPEPDANILAALQALRDRGLVDLVPAR